MKEYIIGIMPKFFKVGFYQKQYYDIYITNKRLLLVWLGESFKPWMLRADPGQNKRDLLENLDIDAIENYSKNNILIKYSQIKHLLLNKRTFFKNGFISINTDDHTYQLYTDDKKINMPKFFHILNEPLQSKVSKSF